MLQCDFLMNECPGQKEYDQGRSVQGREGLCRVGPLGPWGQMGPWPWALAPGPPIITSERDQLHGLLLHGRLLLFEKNAIFVWEVCNLSMNECPGPKEYDQGRSVQGREGLCRVGPLGPWGPIGSPALGPGPWAPDNNVRARSTAWSTAARSTAAWSTAGETQAYDQGRSVQGGAPGSLGANWVPGPGPWPLGPR